MAATAVQAAKAKMQTSKVLIDKPTKREATPTQKYLIYLTNLGMPTIH